MWDFQGSWRKLRDAWTGAVKRLRRSAAGRGQLQTNKQQGRKKGDGQTRDYLLWSNPLTTGEEGPCLKSCQQQEGRFSTGRATRSYNASF
jgi:hypothetical protein